jgi:hypothetical protein
MPLYERHTQSVQFDQLPTRIVTKLTEHAESRQIGLDSVSLWQTRSENPRASSGLRRLLRRRANPTDPDEEHITVVLLHPTQLLVAVDGARRGTSVLSLPLSQASVTVGSAFSSKLDPALSEAHGFTITGYPGERAGSFFLGLGPEPAAAECLSAVREAIAAAKKP